MRRWLRTLGYDTSAQTAEEVVHLVKQEARQWQVSMSQLMAWIVIDHGVRVHQLYPRPHAA
ncbi:MAG: hypothetical protein AAGI71_04855 [Bacteroidota bacterium]